MRPTTIHVLAALALLMLVPYAVAEQTWKDKRLTLEFKNAPLLGVLDTLSEKAGLSYSVSNDVLEAGIILNAKLKDIPVEKAVDRLMKAAGLEYTLSEHGLLSVYSGIGLL